MSLLLDIITTCSCAKYCSRRCSGAVDFSCPVSRRCRLARISCSAIASDAAPVFCVARVVSLLRFPLVELTTRNDRLEIDTPRSPACRFAARLCQRSKLRCRTAL